VNLVGQQIGSYVVERELGSGGTGTVYLCRHTMIDRNVAVKVLHDDQARDPDQVARFFQEAKAAAEIGHPNIIVIIDFGTLAVADGDRAYLMMECLEGMSLDKRLRKGGLSLDDIRHILSQCCSALVASHSKGIVHRDLKPPNIFLCDRSFDHLFVKVVDFGIAKLTTPAPGVRKTQYGLVIGTPAYMSPEQCEGKGAIDHRSDIYSLGVVLYEMLTGTLPFGGEIGDMLIGHLHRKPDPPSARNRMVPPEWEALCLHMMEKAKEDRFQSMSEVGAALDDLVGHARAYAQTLARRAASGHSGHTMIMPGVGPASDGRPTTAGEAASRPTLHVDAASLGLAHPATPAAVPAPVATPPVAAPVYGPVAPVTPASTAPSSGAYPVVPAPGSGAYPAVQPVSVPISGQSVAPVPDSGGYPAVPPTPLAPPHSHAEDRSPYDPIHAACGALAADLRHAAFIATLLVRPRGQWYEVGELCQTSGTAAPAVLPARPSLFVSWLDHPYGDPSLAAITFLCLLDGWSAVFLVPRRRW